MRRLRLLWFMAGLSAANCLILVPAAGAATVLELWMEGPLTDPNHPAVPGTAMTLEVGRNNTESGLGNVTYDVVFSEPLWWTAREYSKHGWVANDGLFDNCDPNEGRDPNSFSSIHFDTVKDPPGSEFDPNTSGLVEEFTFTVPTGNPPRWIFFDIDPNNVYATDGDGNDWRNPLGGTINVIADHSYSRPGVLPHTFGVYVPEPASLLILLVGLGLGAGRRRSWTR